MFLIQPLTRVMGFLEHGIQNALCFTRISEEILCRKSKAFPCVTRLKSCVFNAFSDKIYSPAGNAVVNFLEPLKVLYQAVFYNGL